MGYKNLGPAVVAALLAAVAAGGDAPLEIRCPQTAGKGRSTGDGRIGGAEGVGWKAGRVTKGRGGRLRGNVH